MGVVTANIAHVPQESEVQVLQTEIEQLKAELASLKEGSVANEQG